MIKRFMTVGVIVLSTLGFANTPSIEVFTLRELPVAVVDHASSKVCILDKVDGLIEAWNKKNPVLPIEQLMARAEEKIAEFSQAFDCSMRATHYKLNYLPAIVIEGRWVMYGLRSVDEALGLMPNKVSS